MHARTSDFAALPLPRHAAQAAADLAARHTAPSGSDLPIEGVPAHAPAISVGALAVFRACRHLGVRGGLSRGASRTLRHADAISHLPVQDITMMDILPFCGARGWLPAGAWLSGLR